MRARKHGLVAVLVISVLMPGLAGAAPPANQHFERTWMRTERPVIDGVTSRTWMWGPTARTGAMSEPYLEAPLGFRQVQYLDKTRMEINDPDGDPNSVWHVTNGLLARELITGRIQVGHISHVEVGPADIQIAGDQHPDTPTYRTLSHLLDEPARTTGAVVTTRLEKVDDSFHLIEEPALADYGVGADYFVPETDHTVASPFWQFMTSTGVVRVDGRNVAAPLFEDPFFATGLPITEAYWVYVPVAGEWQDVLLQCFERRCLTYTPGNPPGWEVEAGNIGLHYHRFRYGVSPEVFDCVDLNVATHDDLQRIRNIGPARAQAILEMRPFASIHELEDVSGIGPVTLQQILDEGLACVEYQFPGENDFHHWK